LTINRTKLFNIKLETIIFYIAKDSKQNAKKMKNIFQKKINNLSYMPYKFRQSYYYDNENIRDLIINGYTIPYQIDEENNKILVLDIFKWEDR